MNHVRICGVLSCGQEVRMTAGGYLGVPVDRICTANRWKYAKPAQWEGVSYGGDPIICCDGCLHLMKHLGHKWQRIAQPSSR